MLGLLIIIQNPNSKWLPRTNFVFFVGIKTQKLKSCKLFKFYNQIPQDIIFFTFFIEMQTGCHESIA